MRWSVVILFLFYLAQPVTAADFEVSGQPTSTDAATAFDVSYTFTCPSCEKKTNYFFGVFKLADSNYHFGWMTVKDEWINYESVKDATRYANASPSAEGVWKGTLHIKAIDPENVSNLFKGSGNYVLKILRFTPSSTTYKAEVPIALTYTPPPTPTPQPTPSATTTPPPTPTSTPVPLPSTTPLPTPRASLLHTPNPTMLPLQATETASLVTDFPLPASPSAGEVMGLQETALGNSKAESPSLLIPLLFLSGGALLTAGALPIGLKFIGKEREQNRG